MITNKLVNILDRLERTPSRNDKIGVIKYNRDNTEMRKYFKYIFDPYSVHHLKKLPKVPPLSCDFDKVYDDIWLLCDWLKNQKGLDNGALNMIYWSIMPYKGTFTFKWIEKLLLKKAIAGVATSTVNAALGKDFIPTFKCMLADNKKLVNFEDFVYPCIAQYKLDGFRAIYIPGKGFIGRSGKPISNVNLEDHINIPDIAIGDKPQVFDGELYSHDIHFNEISSILRSDKEIPDSLKYVIYSMISREDWDKRKSNTPYHAQLKRIGIGIKIYGNNNIQGINSFIINNPYELEELYNKALNLGYEGLMVKDPNASYQFKRVTLKSKIMAKIKPEDFADGKIINWFKGADGSKLENKFGGFIIELENGKEVRVGGGFDDKEREKYGVKTDGYIGSWIRISYLEKTPAGSLRGPVFQGIRDCKD